MNRSLVSSLLLAFLAPLVCRAVSPDASSSLRIAIPGEASPDSRPRANQLRDLMSYWIEGFVSPAPSSRLAGEWVTVSTDSIPEDFLDAFQKLATHERPAEVMLDLRRWMAEGKFFEARGVRHRFRLPETEGELERLLDFKRRWRRRIVSSRVKGTARAIYSSPPGSEPVMSIAQTLRDGEASEENVRETEIAIQRDDGSLQWDYYAYDTDGLATSRTTFLSHPSEGMGRQVTAWVPLACANCHYDPTTRRFDRRAHLDPMGAISSRPSAVSSTR